MYDWEITGNEAYNVDGLAFGRFNWIDPPPADFTFTDNYCQDCDLTEFQGETNIAFASEWRELHFINNTIVDGTFALDEVATGSIDGLDITSCDPNPVTVTDSTISMTGIATTLACDLSHDDLAVLMYDPATGEVTLDLTQTPTGGISDALTVLADGSLYRFSGSLSIPAGLDVNTDFLAARWTDSSDNYGNFIRVEVPEPASTTIGLWFMVAIVWPCWRIRQNVMVTTKNPICDHALA